MGNTPFLWKGIHFHSYMNLCLRNLCLAEKVTPDIKGAMMLSFSGKEQFLHFLGYTHAINVYGPHSHISDESSTGSGSVTDVSLSPSRT